MGFPPLVRMSIFSSFLLIIYSELAIGGGRFESKRPRSRKRTNGMWENSAVARGNRESDSKRTRLSETDPSSFSNPDIFPTKSIHLKWNVDFDKKILQGSAQLNFSILNAKVEVLLLDSSELQIERIISNGRNLSFSIGEHKPFLGSQLTVNVGEVVAEIGYGGTFTIEVIYSTSENSSGLQWLNPLQTNGKEHPFLFSQCQPIHARSLLPCQDTPSVKAPYSAEVTTRKELQALMSAQLVGEPEIIDDDKHIYRFEQKQPVPTYLIAIAVGALVSKQIGPRSRVWAEKGLVDIAAHEFTDTEKMLQAAEGLVGEYRWGQYDILVLPPSFPLGGMENPCLTFATPSILAGDKSLVNVICHEISHSWTGNMVTNKDWEHFWLNEGFTVFLERKILGVLQGEQYRQFVSFGGWTELQERIGSLDPELTTMVCELNGNDPDDVITIVPYEKGYAFLYYLEKKVGGPALFEPFFADYIKTYSFQSIDSDTFKTYFIKYFEDKGHGSDIADVDWNVWLKGTGMPPVNNTYDKTLTQACLDLKDQWMEWDSSSPLLLKKSDFDALLPAQKIRFMQELLLVGAGIPLDKVVAMEKLYEMNTIKNAEIRFRWIRICIRAKHKEIIPLALQFANEFGRLKYLEQIYRELLGWEETRDLAIQNFKEYSKYMMSISSNGVQKEINRALATTGNPG